MPTNIREYFEQIVEIWAAYANEQISITKRDGLLAAYRAILPSLQPSK